MEEVVGSNPTRSTTPKSSPLRIPLLSRCHDGLLYAGLVFKPTPAILFLIVAPLLCGQRFDVLIYGGTASGAAAAIAAARSGGVSVALVEPGGHLGGILSGGLGRTDMDRQERLIGGIAREFFERAGRHYGQAAAWTFEPSVAERILNDWLKESGVHVHLRQQIAEHNSVDKDGGRILRFRTTKGATFEAAVFIDASYEGDLMKAAGVSYTVGREARGHYGESYAGRQDFLPGNHQPRVPISPLGPDGNLAPYVVAEDTLVNLGESDGKFQSYCFRLCLTSDPANRLPLPRPDGYDPNRYALTANYLKALGPDARISDFLGISLMPNSKTDINASRISTNVVGASWEYPDATYARRREIWNDHLTWAQGLLYYLANEANVPEHIRKEMNRWGLAKDEFVATGHWPHQLYIREGRRMLGEYVLTQHDLQSRRRKYDSIGMAGYNIDIREVQWVARTVYRFPNMSQELLMEGYVSVPVDPWEIPYRALLPRQHEASNLLVSSCISASTVAYASFRMEPQYMIDGHAAGAAAALAVRTRLPVHHISIPELQRLLREQKQLIAEPPAN